MTKFLLAYHGGSAPSSPAEGEKVMKAWMDWIGGLGKAMLDPGNPTGAARTLRPGGAVVDGGGSDPVTGYSIIEAASLDEAVTLSRGCPQLLANGTVEVTEITPVM